MKPFKEMNLVGWLAAASLGIFSSIVCADCEMGEQGKIVELRIKSCEEIVAEKNTEVQKFAKGRSDLYTGALVTVESGSVSMYPSKVKHPCKMFRRNSLVTKKAYSTCCDTGNWGKCVFGGSFLGDVDAPAINTFQ